MRRAGLRALQTPVWGAHYRRVVGRGSVIAGAAILLAWTLPVFSSPIAPRAPALTISVATLSPVISLVAGVLILIMPRLLNYIVAFYLILAGVVGFTGR